MNERVTLLTVPVTLTTVADAVPILETFFSEKRLHRIATVNPEYLVRAHRDSAFAELLRSADLATADGAGIIFAARFRGASARLANRVTGVELTGLLLGMAEERGVPVLIVLKHNSLTAPEQLTAILEKKYPRLRSSVLREPISYEIIREIQPAVVFTALGAPDQEQWISRNAAALADTRIAIGVGGTFDFLSDTIQRAPRLWRRVGLEWLWRVLIEPKRLGRIVRAVVVFPYLILRSRP